MTRSVHACSTLFDRLLEGGMQADLLAVQYRMHAAICDFPNRWFYGGRLATGVPHRSHILHCSWLACSDHQGFSNWFNMYR